MTYCFRIRFQMGPVRIESDESEWKLADGNETVVLRPREEAASVGDANHLILRGSGYSSQDAAEVAAHRWRSALQAAFARTAIGADFGDRAACGFFSDYRLEEMTERAGRPVMDDIFGTMVYECDPQPLFASFSVGDPTLWKPATRVMRAIKVAVEASVLLTEQQQLAYDLFSASFREATPDGRLTILMMAVEVLIDPHPRARRGRDHIDELISRTRSSELESEEIDSIVHALQGMKSESIGKAGRRLASSLGDRTYGGETPERFFTRCYEMRSQLVHGAFPRPSREEVGSRSAQLEHFVGHLICGQELLAIPD